MTIIAARPSAGRTVQGRVSPVSRSTSSESPTAVASNPIGAMNQQRIRSTGAASYVPGSWLGSRRWREMQSAPTVSVVIPCLNEAQSIEACVRSARRCSRSTGSAARWSSPTTAPKTTAPRWRPPPGARVVHEERRGYGSAYLAGFAAARGHLHHHRRRRPDLRLQRDPPLPRPARRRRRHGDRQPDEQHRARARCHGCTATSATRS